MSWRFQGQSPFLYLSLPNTSASHTYSLVIINNPSDTTLSLKLVFFFVLICLNWSQIKPLSLWIYYVTFICQILPINVSRHSSAGIATRYGVDGPRIETHWRPDFPHPSRSALGPPNLLYNGCRVIPGGKSAGAWRWPPIFIYSRV
jgi:hypothetical protein